MGFLGDVGAAACSSAMVLFSVQAASSAVTESRLMGAAGAAVDDADGVVGEQGVGSADLGQVRPDVPVGLGRGEVCHEWAARIAVQGVEGRVFPIYADARAAVRERLSKESLPPRLPGLKTGW